MTQIGSQLVERYVLGGGVHSISGSDGHDPNFPAMNLELAYRILERDGFITKEDCTTGLPILRVLKNGRLTATYIEPVIAEYVEPWVDR